MTPILTAVPLLYSRRKRLLSPPAPPAADPPEALPPLPPLQLPMLRALTPMREPLVEQSAEPPFALPPLPPLASPPEPDWTLFPLVALLFLSPSLDGLTVERPLSGFRFALPSDFLLPLLPCLVLLPLGPLPVLPGCFELPLFLTGPWEPWLPSLPC